jgi:hypothetical protein
LFALGFLRWGCFAGSFLRWVSCTAVALWVPSCVGSLPLRLLCDFLSAFGISLGELASALSSPWAGAVGGRAAFPFTALERCAHEEST